MRPLCQMPTCFYWHCCCSWCYFTVLLDLPRFSLSIFPLYFIWYFTILFLPSNLPFSFFNLVIERCFLEVVPGFRGLGWIDFDGVILVYQLQIQLLPHIINCYATLIPQSLLRCPRYMGVKISVGFIIFVKFVWWTLLLIYYPLCLMNSYCFRVQYAWGSIGNTSCSFSHDARHHIHYSATSTVEVRCDFCRYNIQLCFVDSHPSWYMFLLVKTLIPGSTFQNYVHFSLIVWVMTKLRNLLVGFWCLMMGEAGN